jgi:hypothetical protein
MEDGSVVVDKGSGTDAFGGLDVDHPGPSLSLVSLHVDGALRFVVGENARALCYDENGNACTERSRSACTERSRSVTWRLQVGLAFQQQWNTHNRLTYVKDWGSLAVITLR